MIFQITGYPRSGTAWLTTMFNLSRHAIAFHELAITDPNWRVTIDKIVKDGYMVGDIGTYQYFPKAVIPESKKVFINQDSLEAQRRVSLATGLDCVPDAHLNWKRMAENWLSEWNPMVVQFENLFKIDTLERIWIYCLGDIESACFPVKKVEQLLRLNIQLHEPAKAISDPQAIERLAELL